MLKIKDSVDLDELTKYGFEKNCHQEYVFGQWYPKYPGVNEYHEHIKISINDRYIRLCEFSSHQLDIIYKLIVDGLVEKVEDR